MADTARCERYRQLDRERYVRDHHKVLFRAARLRADKQGLPFDLEYDDIVIPETCPVLGIPIGVSRGRHTDNSASIDRIEPARGYVRGNVVVVSYRANRIKNDASISELRAVADFYGRMVT